MKCGCNKSDCPSCMFPETSFAPITVVIKRKKKTLQDRLEDFKIKRELNKRRR